MWHFFSLLSWIQAQVDETHVLVLYLCTAKVIKNIYLFILYTSKLYSRIHTLIQVNNQLTLSISPTRPQFTESRP